MTNKVADNQQSSPGGKFYILPRKFGKGSWQRRQKQHIAQFFGIKFEELDILMKIYIYLKCLMYLFKLHTINWKENKENVKPSWYFVLITHQVSKQP